MKSFRFLKKELLRDPAVRREYKRLAPEYELIASVIKKRLAQGMTQKELAAKARTKQSAISRLESGNANPSFAFLQKIAHALNTRLHVSLAP